MLLESAWLLLSFGVFWKLLNGGHRRYKIFKFHQLEGCFGHQERLASKYGVCCDYMYFKSGSLKRVSAAVFLLNTAVGFGKVQKLGCYFLTIINSLVRSLHLVATFILNLNPISSVSCPEQLRHRWHV